ncbi:hypothetical protein B0J11DRAFT_129087 [Dendryphion nanum]|uniref:Uncharacterized protein n=1 Tax=Dendryphion nanum TaxID=256645 RepID=A0A9P9DA76_9PLEO|nr:hypothetical protein B0J11DRAFT_129087 [Dendryphion nanum]
MVRKSESDETKADEKVKVKAVLWYVPLALRACVVPSLSVWLALADLRLFTWLVGGAFPKQIRCASPRTSHALRPCFASTLAKPLTASSSKLHVMFYPCPMFHMLTLTCVAWAYHPMQDIHKQHEYPQWQPQSIVSIRGLPFHQPIIYHPSASP